MFSRKLLICHTLYHSNRTDTIPHFPHSPFFKRFGILMLLLCLVLFLPAPLSERCTSTFSFAPVLSAARISSLTERFGRFSTNIRVRTSSTFKSGFSSTICNTSSMFEKSFPRSARPTSRYEKRKAEKREFTARKKRGFSRRSPHSLNPLAKFAVSVSNYFH